MQERLQAIKDKPQHVRENIALAISGGITLIVFLGWAGSLANSRVFSLNAPITRTADIENPLAKASETKQSVSNLLGAAGASKTKDENAPAIQIVDSPAPEKTLQVQEQTIIHF